MTDENAQQLDQVQSEVADDTLAADVHTAQETGSNDELQRLGEEVKQANDRALRAQAELENFRRRLRRDMEEERRYAALPLISDLLGVVDNLDRAVEAAEKDESASSSLLQGVKMVQSQFLSVLERHHCRRIGEVGAAFNPHEYQAIAQEPSTQIPAGNVTRVVQFGYRLHDRVVRPAQVLVSTGAPKRPRVPRARIDQRRDAPMPTYDYECDACQHRFELFQQISENPKRKCPECGRQKLRRLFGTGAALMFKGSGFYQTDYRSESYKKASAADKKPTTTDSSAGDSSAGAKSDSSSKSESKSESKPAAKGT